MVLDIATEWTGYVQTGGTVGLLTIAVIAFSRDWVVTQKAHLEALAERDRMRDEVAADRDFYRTLLYESLGVTRRHLSATETLTERLMDRRDREDRLQEKINVLQQRDRQTRDPDGE